MHRNLVRVIKIVTLMNVAAIDLHQMGLEIEI